MAKRFTDTNIWSKEWFMKLRPKHKCLVRFLFDNCDSSGVWQPNWGLASYQIGEKMTEDDLKKLPRNQYEMLPDGKIFLPDFIPFQYGELKETCPAHKPVFKTIEKNRVSDRVFNRVSNTLQEKEIYKEEEKETVKEEEKEKEPYIHPHLFTESEFFNFPKFTEAITSGDAGEKYLPFDENYYYEAVKNWSANGNKKIDWIATARGFMLKDLKKGEAKIKKEFQGKTISINNGKQTGGHSDEEIIRAAYGK